MLQCHHKVDEFTHMETVEKFFARCDQDFLTDCRIVAHSCTDAETVGMAAKVENRNIHENGPSVFKDRAKRFKRIKGQAHTAAEIVAGPDRDKSENNRRQINDPGKYFVNSAVTAYCYQSYRILRCSGGTDPLCQYCGVSHIFCEKILI